MKESFGHSSKSQYNKKRFIYLLMKFSQIKKEIFMLYLVPSLNPYSNDLPISLRGRPIFFRGKLWILIGNPWERLI